MSRMARKRTGPSPAELALLGLLAEGPAHPYSLDARLRSGISSAEAAFSSVYAALDRLERFGLVRSREEAGKKGRARRVYSLTSSGRSELAKAVRDSLSRPFLGPFSNDLGVSCLLLLSRDEALTAIGDARRTLREARRVESEDDGYPGNALTLHRSRLLAAEDRFYADLQRIVESSHPIAEGAPTPSEDSVESTESSESTGGAVEPTSESIESRQSVESMESPRALVGS